MKTAHLSPLRYPGGKAKLSRFFIDLIELNNLKGCTYIEPFAGGAGAALALLFNDVVNNIVINDYDRGIYAFWYSVLNRTEELCDLIYMTSVTIREWHRQKEIYSFSDDLLELGFATFFMNRTNRSGIIKGGAIGGLEQKGKYKIDCRFNKTELVKRIKTISLYKDQISLKNMDACKFIIDVLPQFSKNSLVNLDPPYFKKGPGLYTNFYKDQDHENLAHVIKYYIKQPWIVTYDNVEEVSLFYQDYHQTEYYLNYSASNKYTGQEILIYSHDLIPVVSKHLKQCI